MSDVAMFAPAANEKIERAPEVTRGAPDELLDLPAHAFLERVAWAGPKPDPDALDAASFLSWL
jgi:hypothetical protein